MTKQVVLIIDDSKVIQESLKQILCEDYVLLFASSGDEGIEIALKQLPDIILLDVIMPKTDGFGVIKALRNNPETKDIPIIMLTSISDKDCEANGLLAGASDFIHKPINSLVVKLRVGIQARTLGYIRTIKQLREEISELKSSQSQ